MRGSKLLSFTHGLALLIEDFVEKNHQDQFKIEKQTKSIGNKQIRANRAAKIERVADHAGVHARVKHVNKKRGRPPYKKIKKEVVKKEEPQQTTLLESPSTKKQKMDPHEQPKNVTPPSQQHSNKSSSNKQQFNSNGSPAVSMEFEEGAI